jgi:hypothetical protein
MSDARLRSRSPTENVLCTSRLGDCQPPERRTPRGPNPAERAGHEITVQRGRGLRALAASREEGAVSRASCGQLLRPAILPVAGVGMSLVLVGISFHALGTASSWLVQLAPPSARASAYLTVTILTTLVLNACVASVCVIMMLHVPAVSASLPENVVSPAAGLIVSVLVAFTLPRTIR